MFWETHQQITTSSQTQKFHHSVHSLPLVWIMSHTNPENTLPFLRYILITVFHLCLILPSLLSPLIFATNTLYEFTPMRATCPTHPDIFWVYHPRKIRWGLKINKFSSMEYSPMSSYTHSFVHIFSSTQCSQTLPSVLQTKFHTHAR